MITWQAIKCVRTYMLQNSEHKCPCYLIAFFSVFNTCLKTVPLWNWYHPVLCEYCEAVETIEWDSASFSRLDIICVL